MSDAVEVDGESLLASRRPPASSRAVQRASARLLGELDLSRLVTSLNSVGASLHDAYLGTAAFHELQLRVQRSGFAVTRLGDRAAAELDAGRHAAAAALDDLECVYDLLADGMEDVALATLRATNGSSARLADAARQLAADFDAAADEAHATLAEALVRMEEQEKRRSELAANVAEYRILLAQAQNAKRASDDGFDEADRLYQDALRKEGIASLKNTAIQVAQVATAVASCVSHRPGLGVLGVGGVAALSGAVESEMLRVREEKAVYLHERHKQRLSALDNGKEIAELAARLRVTRDEDAVASETLQSLEDAVAGLRSLAAIMVKAEAFWSQLDSHCNESEAAALEAMIKSSSDYSQEERAQVWMSDKFKRRTVMAYAPWVALENVCNDYCGQMAGTRSSLYRMLESPGSLAAAGLPAPGKKDMGGPANALGVSSSASVIAPTAPLVEGPRSAVDREYVGTNASASSKVPVAASSPVTPSSSPRVYQMAPSQGGALMRSVESSSAHETARKIEFDDASDCDDRIC